MTAPVEFAPVREVEARRGTVTLVEHADRWVITGVSKVRTVHGQPASYACEIVRCDCRTNKASERRRAWPRSANVSTCSCSGIGSQARVCGHHTNLGTRPLCPKPVRHNATCHRMMDHCPMRSHDPTYLTKIFDGVVRTYR
jgi:hypothetical protein